MQNSRAPKAPGSAWKVATPPVFVPRPAVATGVPAPARALQARAIPHVRPPARPFTAPPVWNGRAQNPQNLASPKRALLQRAALPDHLVTSADRPPPLKGLIPKAVLARPHEAPRDLGASERYWHEGFISNGLLYSKAGLSNKGGLTLMQAQVVRTKVIYVLTADDRLLLRSEPAGIQARVDSFTHANFTGGLAIKAAGQLYVVGGHIIRMDNESGHYCPAGNALRHLLKKFKRDGADLSKCLMVMNHGDYDVEAFDAVDWTLGQKTKVSMTEANNQDMKFCAYTMGKDWSKEPVDYW